MSQTGITCLYIINFLLILVNLIGGVMVSVALRRKGKDWLARNRNNVSEVGLLICPRTVVSLNYHYKNQTKRVGLVQSGPHHHLIENSLVLAMI